MILQISHVCRTREYLDKIWGVEGQTCLVCQQIMEITKVFILTQHYTVVKT